MKRNLKTNNYSLRERTLIDLSQLLKLPNSVFVKKLNLTTDFNIENEKKRIKRLIGRSSDEYILWDIYENNNHLNIGNLGFHNLSLEHKRSEIGYWCHQDWRNKGVIQECLSRIIKYGFEILNLNRIEAYLDEKNGASEAVLKKLNFTKEGLLRQHYIHGGKVCDSLVYSLLKDDVRQV
ncbi:MAG: GNAT family N-acetyltransferase [Saprospiraceae bacterium]|nr:GNAT family N-acetyltransferase [Saprospiraceae bacterium]